MGNQKSGAVVTASNPKSVESVFDEPCSRNGMVRRPIQGSDCREPRIRLSNDSRLNPTGLVFVGFVHGLNSVSPGKLLLQAAVERAGNDVPFTESGAPCCRSSAKRSPHLFRHVLRQVSSDANHKPSDSAHRSNCRGTERYLLCVRYPASAICCASHRL